MVLLDGAEDLKVESIIGEEREIPSIKWITE